MIADDATVEVGARQVAEFVIFNALEEDIDVYVPEGVERDDVMRVVCVENVHSIEAIGGEVEVQGSGTVARVIDRIPASGGSRFEPPTNPPEVVTEDCEVVFAFRFEFEELGFVDGSIEVY